MISAHVSLSVSTKIDMFFHESGISVVQEAQNAMTDGHCSLQLGVWEL